MEKILYRKVQQGQEKKVHCCVSSMSKIVIADISEETTFNRELWRAREVLQVDMPSSAQVLPRNMLGIFRKQQRGHRDWTTEIY